MLSLEISSEESCDRNPNPSFFPGELKSCHRHYRWARSIIFQRRAIQRLLQDSPSLKTLATTAFEQCYRDAKAGAASETGLPLNQFPEQCTWSIQQILDDDFWPGD